MTDPIAPLRALGATDRLLTAVNNMDAVAAGELGNLLGKPRQRPGSASPLLPCPFCGSAPKGMLWPNGGKMVAAVCCDACGTEGPNESTEAEAAERWNERPTLSVATVLGQLAAELEADLPRLEREHALKDAGYAHDGHPSVPRREGYREAWAVLANDLRDRAQRVGGSTEVKAIVDWPRVTAALRLLGDGKLIDATVKEVAAAIEGRVVHDSALDTYLSADAESPHGDPADCPTWYDWCHCTAACLADQIERAEAAEAKLADHLGWLNVVAEEHVDVLRRAHHILGWLDSRADNGLFLSCAERPLPEPVEDCLIELRWKAPGEGTPIEGPIDVRPRRDDDDPPWAWVAAVEGEKLHNGNGWPVGLKSDTYQWRVKPR